MANNISAIGLTGYLTANKTFPFGILLSQFADDIEGFKMEESIIGGTKIDLNGKIVRWTSAVPVVVHLGVIPHSDNDNDLGVLFNSNRSAAFSRSADDVINLVMKYPDGTVKTYTNGKIVGGPVGTNAHQTGRMNSNIYTFNFEDVYILNASSVINRALSDFVDLSGLLESI